ncbi:MAG: helix-turn-helix domain-containing protein [Steroidobacteraceae bacterium]
MPIIFNLEDLLHARRITLSYLAADLDITLENLSIVKTAKARAIRFSTLEALCQVLERQLSALLTYVAERRRNNSAQQAVQRTTSTTGRKRQLPADLRYFGERALSTRSGSSEAR